MRYLSVCSGIEAASEAWRGLGWQCAGVSEIEKFPRAVLEQRLGAQPVEDDHRHKPGANSIPLFGDFTKIRSEHVGPVDLLVGGTPCQSFSVAGKRLGLDDPRGNLTLEFLALARRVQPRWIVWENVPGVLSHDGGRTFGTFLRFVGECGFRWAYRVLDAQYVRVDRFGRAVPQRRRRVFLVGYSGTACINPAAVLFDRESLRGNPAPRREAGEGTAADVAPSLVSSGRGVERTGETRRQDPVVAQPVANPLTARMHKGVNTTMDEGQTMIAHALRGEGFDASEDGTGRGAPMVPVAIQERAISENPNAGPDGKGWRDDATAYTLEARTVPQAIAFPAEMSATQCASAENISPSLSVKHTTAVAFDLRGREGGAQFEGPHETANIRAASGGSSRSYVAQTWGVRRLTPRECERLMGFPEVQDYAIFFVCSDPPKTDAPAALKCPKLQSNAWLVEGGRWRLSAEAAGQHLSTSPQDQGPRVAVDVLIDLEQMAVEISSLGKSFSSATDAGKKSSFPLHIPIDDFALLAALTTQCLAREMQGGRAVSPDHKKHSTPHESGSSIAISSGSATEVSAVDAESAIKQATHFITSTTSRSGQSIPLCASTLKTLCCSVAHAIGGFIPEKTKAANSYAVRLTITRGFTKIEWRGKPADKCPDGPRYKALGNSMAVNCMAWIGERIAAVEAIAQEQAA